MRTRLGLVPRESGLSSFLPERNLFDRIFNGLWPYEDVADNRNWMPAFDISETEKEYVVEGEIPGINAKDVDITFSEGVLTLKGEKKREKEDKEGNFHRIERCYGSFQRSFRLPENIKTDKLDATYKDGLLRISLPKSEEKAPRKIKVKNEN